MQCFIIEIIVKKIKGMELMDKKIKVLFLDIDNTLLDFNAAAQWGMEQCFIKAGLVYEPSMFAVFEKENNKIWRRIEKGELSMDDLPNVRWQAILKQLGMKADGVEMEMEFRRLLHLSAVPMDGAQEILKYLYDKKYCLCAASNGPYEQQINRLKKADMLKYFTYFFVSEKMGADKPSREFFDGCMRELTDTKPEECMMIGDSLTADINGGREYGIQTCWLRPCNSKENVENSDKDQNKSGKEADHVISSLLELKNIL